MAKTRLNPEKKDELHQILEHINNRQNFLLSGGAGSGKTYSLVEVIEKVIEENPTAKIACMTFTNAAVKEIESRVNHKNLRVSTIHDFLWDEIKHFQNEIKITLIELINDPDCKKIANNQEESVPADFFDHCEKGIQYLEYIKIKDGIISHDEVLIVANKMFEKYKNLRDILIDKYQFIFIDEYQDSQEEVIRIFLEHLKRSNKKNIIGLFGDAMQSIYDNGIGDINIYIGEEDGKVKEVKKEQNRRNPKLVYELANRLRTDGLIQTHSEDSKAPNMENGQVKEGSIKFIYSTNEDLTTVRNYLKDNYGWNFEDTLETKELNLTHNLIANKAGFKTLMDIYDSDPIIKLKNDILRKIKDNKNKGVPDIIFDENDSFDSVVDKFMLKDRSKQLKKEVILSCPNNKHLYDSLKDKPFSEVRRIYLDKDSLIDDKKESEDEESKKGSKRDNLIKHLFKIQNIIQLYNDGMYNEFLRKTNYIINSIQDKRDLKQKIEELRNVQDKTIGEIIYDANTNNICLMDDNLEKFKREYEYIYNRVKDVKYEEFQHLYKYLEGSTPFSTQHKTKGREYNNVLVILDNGDWNDYNFNYLFNSENVLAELNAGKSKTKSKLASFPKILARTQKIFYVCCTRSKENLAVFFHNPSQPIIDKAIDWFGSMNIINLD